MLLTFNQLSETRVNRQVQNLHPDNPVLICTPESIALHAIQVSGQSFIDISKDDSPICLKCFIIYKRSGPS